MAGKSKNTAVSVSTFLIRTILRILIYIVAVILIIWAAKRAYSFGYLIFGDLPAASAENAQEVTVIVREDQSVRQVGTMLEDKGLISDNLVFVVQERLYRQEGEEIQPGTYILDTSQNVEEILAVLYGKDTEGQPGLGGASDTSEASQTPQSGETS